MKRIFSVFLLSFGLWAYAQNKEIDPNYLEDQFYLSLSYNLLINKPSKVNQYNFSRNISAGFIRDIPLNKERNMGIGIGIGYAYDLAYSNVVPQEQNQQIQYRITSLEEEKITKNYLQKQSIELTPIELRWRTSTPEKNKFWRIYTGAKIGYIFWANTLTKNQNAKQYLPLSELKNRLNYRVYTAVGHGTWNLFFQYCFTPLLKTSHSLGGTSLQMNELNIGIIFYIL